MPAPRFRVTVSGIQQNKVALENLGKRATNARPAMEEVLDVLMENERDIWARDGGAGGKHWAPNAESTRKTKAAKGEMERPLRATGALEKSLTIKGAPHQIREATETSATFGTDLFYAKINQGFKDKRKRESIRLLPKARKKIAKIIRDWLVTGN